MVFRKALALLCIAAAVALSDASVAVDSKQQHHHGKQHAVAAAAPTETKIEYPTGTVLVSTSEDKGKPTAHQKALADSADESSDDVAKHAASKHHHKKEHQSKKAGGDKKVVESTGANGELKRKYAYGAVRISKGESASAHGKTHKQKKAHAADEKVVTKDFELKEGVNEFEVEGVPLKVTVNHGDVDVSVNGKPVKAGAEVVVDAPEKPAAHKKAHDAHKKAHDAHKKSHDAHKKQPEAAVAAAATDDKAKAVDAQAARVTELATKLSSNSHGFFSSETAPIVFVCGIVGALAAVVGIAAVAVARTRGQSTEAGNLQSVLSADAADVDVEAAVQDAPADQTDSLEDSESDNDDDEDAGEGTFANNEHAGVVAV